VIDDAQRAGVDSIFAAYLAQEPARAPGVAYGVVRDGVLVHAGGAGTLRDGEDALPDAASVFRIASMTKSFVAAAVLLLRDDGALRLDDRADDWVPELAGLPRATPDSPPLTLRHLLSMASGYPEDDPWADRLEAMPDDDYTAMIGAPATFARAPGIAFDYSNYGFTLLGRVIDRAAARPYRDAIRELLLEPLGLHDTRWSDDGLDPRRVAVGYAREDDAWVPQPVQAPGAFSALGGLYSTVADLATWVGGFTDAWPPRAGDDGHPLSRASRREMQQVVTALPLQIGDGAGLLRVQAHGYCLGLMSQEDLATGRTVGHSGGYPGFGSRMTWHPATGVGVIALANGRYARPGGAVAEALAMLVGATPARLDVAPVPALTAAREAVDGALAAGDLDAIVPLLADNVDLDEALPRRAARVAALAGAHGRLTPVGDLRVMTPTQAAWALEGERGRVCVEVMVDPGLPSRIQLLRVESVLPPSPTLERALAEAIAALAGDHDLGTVLLPLRATSWVACDGERTGAVLLEGAHLAARLALDLDADPVATIVPEERWPLPA
jgi:CubicO group peptidase (beta-lactamase class C family)